MSILSLSFVIFLAAAFLVYFLTPGKYQWIALLVISYVFYLFAGVRAIIFILITTTTTFFAGRWIGKINDEFDVAVANYQGPNPKMTRDE
ncbi:MAG: MBOAT family protein, partial [Clostridia bacterium]|nr:MBOAT family protein [Clostridia bacterium]